MVQTSGPLDSGSRSRVALFNGHAGHCPTSPCPIKSLWGGSHVEYNFHLILVSGHGEFHSSSNLILLICAMLFSHSLNSPSIWFNANLEGNNRLWVPIGVGANFSTSDLSGVPQPFWGLLGQAATATKVWPCGGSRLGHGYFFGILSFYPLITTKLNLGGSLVLVLVLRMIALFPPGSTALSASRRLDWAAPGFFIMSPGIGVERKA